MGTLNIKVRFERDYDVVVVGGGTTGVCASLAAARSGAKTAVVETGGFLGGMASIGFPWNGFHNYAEKKFTVRGIPLEIVAELQSRGGASEFHYDPVMESLVQVNGSMLKILLMEMTAREKIDLYLHSLAEEPLIIDNKLAGVYIHNKQGCELLRAKVVIDCTESADIAVKAGVPCYFGRKSDGQPQISSAVFSVTDIDMEALISYLEKIPGNIRPRKFTPDELAYVAKSLRESPLSCIGAFQELIEKAVKDGLSFPKRNMLSGTIYPKLNEMILVASKVPCVNPADADNYSLAEIEGYKQVGEIFRFIKEYMPGGKNARIIDIGHQIGIRETVHIQGLYELSAGDLQSGQKFNDAIAAGSYIMDIHSPNHGGLEPCTDLPTYYIPYRCLVPVNIDGLLVAGRCISATHEAESAFRMIPITGAIGQGAGTAAALSICGGVSLQKVDSKVLKQKLIEDGAEVGQSFNSING